jgi:pyruvate dehydrogenase (quinone)
MSAPAAWRGAFEADRPVLIEAIVDPSTPMLPPRMPDAG